MTRQEAIGKTYGMSGTKEQHEALEFLVPEIRVLREFYERQQEKEHKSADLTKMMVHKEPYLAPVPIPMVTDEQKPIEPSNDELQRHQDELYDFKVFATKQAKEHHISHIHDFEWNNFCAALLSYFNEQKPASISCGHENDAEWGQEDKEKIVTISEVIEHCTTIPYSGGTLTLNKEYKKELLCFIKSLRPQYHGDVTMTEAYKMGFEAGKASSWKPSEEQMKALNKARRFIPYNCDILESLYNQLKKL